jgi:hypothetical protein
MRVKSKEVILVPKNARTFTLMPGDRGAVATEVGDRIIALDTGQYTICKGDVINVKKKPYKVNTITKDIVGKKLVYNLSTSTLTKSSMFVMPMLGAERRLFMFDSLFVNCFINTKEHKNKIALLYRFSGDKLFLKFEQALQQFRGFVDYYDPSPHFVLFVFNVPDQHKENYVHFLNGRYSQLSPDYKDKILDFHGFDIDGQLGQILFKSTRRRMRLEAELGVELDDDAEVYSIMNEEEETFNPKIYI